MAVYDAGFRSGTRRASSDRKLEIVNGRAFSASQTYFARQASDLPNAIVTTTPSAYKPKAPSSYSGSKSSWSFNDPEMKRRKRVAKYKMYSVEGKVKLSFRKGIRWMKTKCSELVHGW